MNDFKSLSLRWFWLAAALSLSVSCTKMKRGGDAEGVAGQKDPQPVVGLAYFSLGEHKCKRKSDGADVTLAYSDSLVITAEQKIYRTGTPCEPAEEEITSNVEISGSHELVGFGKGIYQYVPDDKKAPLEAKAALDFAYAEAWCSLPIEISPEGQVKQTDWIFRTNAGWSAMTYLDGNVVNSIPNTDPYYRADVAGLRLYSIGLDRTHSPFGLTLDLRAPSTRDSNRFDGYEQVSSILDPAKKKFLCRAKDIRIPNSPGDANGDGCVGYSDIDTISKNWGNQGTTGLEGDTNGDGVVNIFDINMVSANFKACTTVGGHPADINSGGCIDSGDLAIVYDNLGLQPATKADGDANGDGKVSAADVDFIRMFWAPCR